MISGGIEVIKLLLKVQNNLYKVITRSSIKALNVLKVIN